MARNTPTWDRTYRRNRAIVLAASDTCWICGKEGADTADHIIPDTLGGSSAVSNLRPAHSECNKKRGKRDVSQVNVLKTSTEW